MDDKKFRRAGVSAFVGGVLWLIALVPQHALDLWDRTAGVAYYVNQTLFMLALAAIVVALFSLVQVRAAGDGRFGRVVLTLFACAFAVILLAGLLHLTLGHTGSPLLAVAEVLIPVAGLSANITGVLTGVAVVRARRLPGWRRWVMLLQAVYYILALTVPIIIANAAPSFAAETGWQLWWLLLGVAAYTSPAAATDRAQPRVAGGIGITG